MAHFINCRIDRGPMDLSTPISYYRKALELRHVGHPDRSAMLLHLAKVLLYRYGELGLEEFSGEIMEFVSEVQACCSVDSHEHLAAGLVLQTYALYKVISSGSLADIDKLIPALRQAVQDIPRDYFDNIQRLTNLGLALRIRYEFCGHRGDLDESIAIHEEAMQLTPCDLDSPTHTQFLKEWAKATLAGGSWKNALVTAASVSISFFFNLPSRPDTLGLEFVVPRFTIYLIICECLQTIGRITDASECVRQMVDELVGQANAHDEQVQWVLGEWSRIPCGCVFNFKWRCSGKLEGLGDTAMSAELHDVAISRYSVVLSLNPAAPQGLFIKRSKAYTARGLWEDALNDANKVCPFVSRRLVLC
jgi:tetratricopeptide (TPR) repeat protein